MIQKVLENPQVLKNNKVVRLASLIASNPSLFLQIEKLKKFKNALKIIQNDNKEKISIVI
jgi:hypothetical protein